MKVIGVTGGIGTGKSTVCNILKEKGGYVISTDEISHKILEPGGAAYDEVLDVFGTVERAALAAMVFSDKEVLEKLNEITHRHIAAKVREEIEMVKARAEAVGENENEAAAEGGDALGKCRFIVLEVPLPVREGFLEFADYVIAVTADEDTRVRRLCEYRGFSEQDARARIANQPTPEVYASIADVVVDNSADDLQHLPNSIIIDF